MTDEIPISDIAADATAQAEVSVAETAAQANDNAVVADEAVVQSEKHTLLEKLHNALHDVEAWPEEKWLELKAWAEKHL